MHYAEILTSPDSSNTETSVYQKNLLSNPHKPRNHSSMVALYRSFVQLQTYRNRMYFIETYIFHPLFLGVSRVLG